MSLSPFPTRGRARRLPVALPVLAVSLLGAVIAGGCANREQAADPSSDPDTGSDEVAQLFPIEVTPPGGEPITLDQRPERIVSLSASNTETLFAIGAGDQVVAVDEQSNYPQEAPTTDLSGLNPNTEAISDHNPDLVVISDDADDLVSAMTTLNIPVLTVPAAATLDDLYAGFELLGDATGHPDQARDLATRTEEELDKLAADTPRPDEPLTYYHELDTDLYSVTSETFIGQVYSLFGLDNIADPADIDSGGYPQLSTEHILSSDPDLIFLADVKCCGQNARTVAKRPGWDTLSAVRDGNVVELDDDLASRWGPRVVDLARLVADAVSEAGDA